MVAQNFRTLLLMTAVLGQLHAGAGCTFWGSEQGSGARGQGPGAGDPPTDPRPLRSAESEPRSIGVLGPAPAPQSRIVEPTPGWPRVVEDLTGRVTIPAKPMRIHTLSVGYDEITFRLVDPSRIVAVGRSTANPDLSNVAAEAQAIPNRVGRNAEEVVALQPDLVVASPFSNRDLVEQLRAAHIPLVLADLVNSADAHEENIRFLAYLYGDEARGEALIQEVRGGLERLARLVDARPPQRRPRVLLLSGATAAGRDTNEDGLLRLAGATNAAAEAGITGHREIGLEGFQAIDPDVIVIAETDPNRPGSAAALVQHPALEGVKAIRDKRILRVKWSLVTTLSHWNIVGAEEIARGLSETTSS